MSSAERTFKVLATGEYVKGLVARRRRGELTVRTASGVERYLRESDVEDVTSVVEAVTES
jgi:hypothetical protein